MEDKWAHAVKAPCKNWVGDYVHENGNYENECMFCHGTFYGFKNRVVCHLCNDLTKDQIAYVVGLEEKISQLYGEQYGSADWVDMRITPLEEEIKRLKDRGLELANDLVKANQKLITESGRIEQLDDKNTKLIIALGTKDGQIMKLDTFLSRLYDDYKRNALDIHQYMKELEQIFKEQS